MSPDSTPLALCQSCGYSLHPHDRFCPRCGRENDQTQDVEPIPHIRAESLSHWPVEPPADLAFTESHGLMLQALPSGSCLSHDLPNTLMLGRDLDPALEDALDLASLKAREHGVSRHHCLFQRSGIALTVIDLGSTNGTYLNGVRLTPHRLFTVSDGDHLVLGTLHLIVSFARLSGL